MYVRGEESLHVWFLFADYCETCRIKSLET